MELFILSNDVFLFAFYLAELSTVHKLAHNRDQRLRSVKFVWLLRCTWPFEVFSVALNRMTSGLATAWNSSKRPCVQFFIRQHTSYKASRRAPLFTLARNSFHSGLRCKPDSAGRKLRIVVEKWRLCGQVEKILELVNAYGCAHFIHASNYEIRCLWSREK